MLTVHYTDGTSQVYTSEEEASDGISETVVDTDFAVAVEKITSNDGARYVYSFLVKVSKVNNA